MMVQVDLPDELAEELRKEHPDLGAYLKEVLGVQLFRDDRFSEAELCSFLSMDRCATVTLLENYRVTEQGLTLEDFDKEAKYPEDFRK